MSREIVIIGDIHGSFDELKELLTKINFDPKIHDLCFAGDLVDRSPFSYETVKFVKELCERGEARCVLGNHENKHVRYREHQNREALTGIKNPMNKMSKVDFDIHQRLSFEDIAWMKSLPLSIHLKEDWHLIHGGLESAFDFENQNPEQIIRCRFVDEKGRAKSLTKERNQPKSTKIWTEVWNGKQSIVYGHFVHSLEEPRIDRNENNICVGIDCGAVYGGHLVAFFLDRFDFVKVKSKNYYKMFKEKKVSNTNG